MHALDARMRLWALECMLWSLECMLRALERMLQTLECMLGTRMLWPSDSTNFAIS